MVIVKMERWDRYIVGEWEVWMLPVVSDRQP